MSGSFEDMNSFKTPSYLAREIAIPLKPTQPQSRESRRAQPDRAKAPLSAPLRLSSACFSTPKACKKPLTKTHPNAAIRACVCRIRPSKKTGPGMASGWAAPQYKNNVRSTLNHALDPRPVPRHLHVQRRTSSPRPTRPRRSAPRAAAHHDERAARVAAPSLRSSLDPPAARRVAPTRTQRARLVEGLDKKNHIATPAASAYCAATTRSRKHSAWRGWPGGASLSNISSSFSFSASVACFASGGVRRGARRRRRSPPRGPPHRARRRPRWR